MVTFRELTADHWVDPYSLRTYILTNLYRNSGDIYGSRCSSFVLLHPCYFGLSSRLILVANPKFRTKAGINYITVKCIEKYIVKKKN